MSQRIAILPELITNKIAAGEVVERPASVFKELVENALDAGATEIGVELTAGGRRLIRITDNGHGMSREDALLSLERHATSKIRNDADLDRIITLGFRGEALPSIASVSRFRLATREPESPEGTEIIVEGGRVRDVKACGMAPGTVITVEQLFFNTPARQKFLRSAETEGSHVADALTRMAVSRPGVAFTCHSDGRELLRVQRGDLPRRLAQTLGKNTAAGLHEVSLARDGFSISGFISAPSVYRSGTSAMFTYINGRFVRDKVIQHAIMQAYRGVIDRGRYPVVALFLNLAPGEVDVNVHPTKHEVRFRRQAFIHDTLQESITELLRRSPWLSRPVAVPAAAPPPASDASQAYRERIAAAAQASLAIPPGSASTHHRNHSQNNLPETTEKQYPDDTAVCETSAGFSASGNHQGPEGYFSSLRIIGQFHGEYLLCQSGDELVIIDQHAASERVAFERLRREFDANAVESQGLLLPETVELSFSEAETARRHRNDLRRMGIELEPFGGNTVIISALPRLAADHDGAGLVRGILAELDRTGSNSAFLDIRDALLSRIACHSVVRGRHQLEERQMTSLLRAMDATDFAASCPHGRPVSHVIGLAELEKIFKRT